MERVLKPILHRAVRSPAFSALVRMMAALGSSGQNLFFVLTYHRIDDPARDADLYPRLISATPEEFEAQMTLLAANCRVVPLSDVLAAMVHGAPLPPKAVLVTFDDAYEDFALHAWPVLRRYRLPSTLFVPTAYPGQSETAFWWDRLHQAIRQAAAEGELTVAGKRLPLSDPRERKAALRTVVRHVKELSNGEVVAEVDRICRELGAGTSANRVLDWGALRDLVSQGLTLAPHSRTHRLLNRLPIEEAVEEAVGSLRDLEREIGSVEPCFAYPGGRYGEELPGRLAREGFRMAFTTCRGVNDLRSSDPLRLRRINVGRTTSTALLRAQLLPWMRAANRFHPLAGSS